MVCRMGFLRCRMGIVHIVALLIGTLQFIGGSGQQPEDIKDDYCRYKFFITPLSWNNAHKVCNATNRTLAKVANTENLTALVQMAKKSVIPRVPHHLSSSSEIWIGLRAEYIHDSFTHYWEDCDTLDDNGSLWLNGSDQIAGCVALELAETKFTINNCTTEERPFICEASSAVRCYDKVNWTIENIFKNFSGDGIEHTGQCKWNCDEHECIAFQGNGAKCLILSYQSAAGSLNGFNERYPAYTIGYIGVTVPAIISTLPAPSMTCFESISSSKLSTSSPSRTQPSITSSEVVDSIMSSEIEGSMTSSTLEGLLTSTGFEGSMTSSRLEGSMTSLVLEGTRTTPPLIISSTNLELAGSLPSSPISRTNLELDSSTIKSGLEDSTTTTKLNISIATSEHKDVSSLNSSSNETVCMCPCSMIGNTTYSPDELERRITEIREKLTIDRKKTSVYKRLLISAPDESISVRSIGYVGVAVLAAICAAIVLMDLPKGVACLREFINKCR